VSFSRSRVEVASLLQRAGILTMRGLETHKLRAAPLSTTKSENSKTNPGPITGRGYPSTGIKDTEYLIRKLSTGIKRQLLQDLGHAPRTLQLMWRLLSFSPLSVLKMAARHVSSKTSQPKAGNVHNPSPVCQAASLRSPRTTPRYPSLQHQQT